VTLFSTLYDYTPLICSVRVVVLVRAVPVGAPTRVPVVFLALPASGKGDRRLNHLYSSARQNSMCAQVRRAHLCVCCLPVCNHHQQQFNMLGWRGRSQDPIKMLQAAGAAPTISHAAESHCHVIHMHACKACARIACKFCAGRKRSHLGICGLLHAAVGKTQRSPNTGRQATRVRPSLQYVWLCQLWYSCAACCFGEFDCSRWLGSPRLLCALWVGALRQ
jgi:hypothetical protein